MKAFFGEELLEEIGTGADALRREKLNVGFRGDGPGMLVRLQPFLECDVLRNDYGCVVLYSRIVLLEILGLLDSY